MLKEIRILIPRKMSLWVDRMFPASMNLNKVDNFDEWSILETEASIIYVVITSSSCLWATDRMMRAAVSQAGCLHSARGPGGHHWSPASPVWERVRSRWLSACRRSHSRNTRDSRSVSVIKSVFVATPSYWRSYSQSMYLSTMLRKYVENRNTEYNWTLSEPKGHMDFEFPLYLTNLLVVTFIWLLHEFGIVFISRVQILTENISLAQFPQEMIYMLFCPMLAAKNTKDTQLITSS